MKLSEKKICADEKKLSWEKKKFQLSEKKLDWAEFFFADNDKKMARKSQKKFSFRGKRTEKSGAKWWVTKVLVGLLVERVLGGGEGGKRHFKTCVPQVIRRPCLCLLIDKSALN